MSFLDRILRGPRYQPEQKAQAVGSIVTPYDIGYHSRSPQDYYRNAIDGYMLDELVYQCMEVRMNAVAEPPICVYRKTGSDEEKLSDPADAPVIELLNQPNPFMDRARFWKTIMMYMDLGGAAYIEKVRSGAGKTVQLWPLRPDRIKVIPNPRTFIGGYHYTLGTFEHDFAPEDIIQLKFPHPLDDFYGLSKLQVLAGRIDLDVWSRKFQEAMFRNAGVPSGMLTVQKHLSDEEKRDLQRRWRELYGGEQGWHRVLVMETGPNQAVEYTPMGLPMGENGLGMNSLQLSIEAKICGVFGVPMSLIPTMLGSQANRGQTAAVSDREAFWAQTMVPLFKDLDAGLTMGLHDEYPEFDRFEHDLTKVSALQEDQDKLHARWRDNLKSGGITVAEFRQKIGLPEEPDEEGVVLLATTIVPTPSSAVTDVESDLLEANQEPEPVPQPAMQPQNGQQNGQNGQVPAPVPVAPTANGRTNGTR